MGRDLWNIRLFELGGHSLLVVRLIVTINEVLKVGISVRELFEVPTIQKLAKFIKGKQRNTIRQDYISVLPLKPSKQNLYIVPALGVSALSYRNMATNLQNIMNVLILSTPEIELEELPLPLKIPSFQEQLEVWFNAIINTQKSGVYRICGHSVGGNFAFELAKKLEQADKEVEVLLLDSLVNTLKASNDSSERSNGSNNVIESIYNIETTSSEAFEAFQKFKRLNETAANAYEEMLHYSINMHINYEPKGTINSRITLLEAVEGIGSSSKRQAIIEQLSKLSNRGVLVKSIKGSHLNFINNIKETHIG